MKNRIELAQHFNSLGFRIRAEIGVHKGYYSEILCQEIPGLKLYAIDPWAVYAEYGWESFAKKVDEIYTMAIKRLAQYNCQIVRKMSMDAVKDFEDGSLDFVFIDCNHFHKYVKEDIEAWTPKVRKGGIVSGHDYYVTGSGSRGVIHAVNDYVRGNGYELKLTDWDKKNSVKDNRQPSWYFVK